MADHMSEMPVLRQNGSKNSQTDNKNELQKFKRLVYIETGILVLTLCVAVAALALSVSKNGDDSSTQTSDACSSAPCGEHGTCTNVPPDTYVCSCVATYYGKNCEKALSDTIFFATYNVLQTSVPDRAPITWDTVRYDPGNNYDTVTGAYTAPSDGYYQFSVTKWTDGEWSNFMILVDGKKDLYCWTRPGSPNIAQTSCTVNMQLQAGQKVQVQQFYGTNVKSLEGEGWINSWFTGQMLYPK